VFLLFPESVIFFVFVLGPDTCPDRGSDGRQPLHVRRRKVSLQVNLPAELFKGQEAGRENSPGKAIKKSVAGKI